MENILHTEQIPFLKTLSIVEGKWKLRILYELAYNPTLRYSELRRNLTPITHKMLSTQLKGLEMDNMIIRKEYPQIPTKVEYLLSEKGRSFLPVMKLMCECGHNHVVSDENKVMSE